MCFSVYALFIIWQWETMVDCLCVLYHLAMRDYGRCVCLCVLCLSFGNEAVVDVSVCTLFIIWQWDCGRCVSVYFIICQWDYGRCVCLCFIIWQQDCPSLHHEHDFFVDIWSTVRLNNQSVTVQNCHSAYCCVTVASPWAKFTWVWKAVLFEVQQYQKG